MNTKLVVFLLFAFTNTLPQAGATGSVPALLAFQGRATDSSGSPVNYTATFNFRIYPPSGSCYVYEETQTITPNQYGFFSILLGGLGFRTGPINAFDAVFSNAAAMPDSCSATYTPSTGDWRRIEVVVDGSAMPTMQTIASTPFSINSEMLNGMTSDQFLQTNGSATQANINLLVSGQDASSLHNHDSVYARLSGSNTFSGDTTTTGSLYATGVASKIGIGTSSPAADIEIQRAAPSILLRATSGSGQNESITFDSGTTQRARIEAAEGSNDLRFYTGSTEALHIDANQNAYFDGRVSVTKQLSLGQYTSATEPALLTSLALLGSSAAGTVWMNTSTNQFKVWDGTTAVSLGANEYVTSVGAGTGLVNTGTGAQPVLNVAYGTAAGTAVQGNASFSGDVYGTYNSLSVVGLQGRWVSTAAPVDGQILKWNGSTSAWEPSPDNNSGGTVTTITGGSGLLGGVITTTGTLSVNSGNAAYQIAFENAQAQLAQQNASVVSPAYSFSASPDTGLYSPGSGKLAFANAGTASLFLDINGNVGVGTMSPAATFDVNGSLHATSLSGNGSGLSFTGGTNNYLFRNSSGNLTAGSLYDVGTRLNLNPAGSVTQLMLSNTSSGAVAGSDGLELVLDTNNASLVNRENGTLSLGTNNVARVTVDASGQVGIGTATPAAILDVYGTGAQSAFVVPRDSTTNRPSTGVNGMIRYNSDGNQLESFVNGMWQTIAVGAGVGTVQSITAGTALLGGTISSNGTLSVDVGTAAYQVVRENASAQISQSAGTVAAPAYTFGGSNDTGLYSPGAGAVAIATSGSAALSVTSAGNVGVGVLTPSQLFTLKSTGSLGWDNGAGTADVGLSRGATNTLYVGNGASADASGTLVAGRLGIGTAAPQAGLDVNTVGTGASAVIFPRDTSVNRPAGVNGMLRYNTDIGQLEGFVGGLWQSLAAGTAVGTVQNITTSTGLLGGPITASGTLSVDVGNTSGKIVQENTSAQIAQTNGSVSAPTYAFSSSPSTGIYSPGPNSVAIAAAGTAALTVLPSGAVGIGTATPGSTASVYGTFDVTDANYSYLGITAGQATLGSTGLGASIVLPSSGAATYNANNGFTFNAANANGFVFQTGGGARLTLTQDGLLGLGTSAPAGGFDIALTGTAGSALIVPRDSSANRPSGVNGMIRYNASANVLESFVNGSWQSVAVGSAVGTVQSITGSTGLLGGTITANGTLSVDVGSTAGKIVQENANAQIAQTNGSAGAPAFSFANDTDSGLFSLGAGTASLATNGTARLTIDDLGRVGVGTTLPAAALDIVALGTNSALILPRDIQTNRPSGANGMVRYNTSTNVFEGFANGIWQTIASGTGVGTVQTITGSTGLLGGTITANGTLSVDVGSAAGKIVQENANAQIAQADGSAGAPSFSFANSPTTGWFSPGAGIASLATSGVARVTIDANGNMGVGTSTPGALAEFYGTGTQSAVLLPRDTSANRPAGANGLIRYNTALGAFEGFASGIWQTIASGGAVGTVQNIVTSTGLLGGPITASGTISVDVGLTAGKVVQENASAQIAQLNGSAGAPSFSFANSPSTGLYSANTNSLSLATNGTAALTIQGNGYVAVGTSSAGYPMDIAGAARTLGDLHVQTGNAGGGIVLGADVNANSLSANTRKVGQILVPTYDNASPNVSLFTGDNDGTNNGAYFGGYPGSTAATSATQLHFLTSPALNTLGGTERMTVTGAGAVGIGTTSPNAILELYATGSQSALILPRDLAANRPTGANGMVRYNTSTNVFEGFANGAWQTIASGPAVGTVQSITGSTGLLGGTITANGTLTVDVGTTAGKIVQENANAQIAQANGSAGAPSFSFGSDTTSGLFSLGVGTASLATGGTSRFTIDSIGRVGIGTNSPTALAEFYGTGALSAILLPRDTAANRPTGTNGMIRYNSAGNVFEGFANGIWQTLASGTGVGTVQTITTSTGLLGGTITANGTISVDVGTAAAKIVQENASSQIAQSNGNASLPAFSFVGSPNSGLFSPSTNSVALSANGTAGVTVTSTGQVAIGTTATNAALEVFALGTTSAILLPRDIQSNRPVGTNGMIRYNTTLNALESFVNGSWQTVAVGAGVGTVQSITGSTGLLGGTITANGTLTVDVGTAANKIVQENANAQIAQSNGSVTLPAFSFVNSPSTGWYSPGAGTAALATNGTARLTVDAVGNVGVSALGVGTNTPGALAEFYGTGALSAILLPRDTAANRPTGTNGMIRYNSAGNVFEGFANGIWQTLASGTGVGTVQTITTSTGLLGGTITANGTISVDVGTAAAKIVQENANAQIAQPNGSMSAPAFSFVNSPSTGWYSPGAGTASLSTNGQARMTVDANGNIGIGTSAPLAFVDFYGTGTQSALLVPRDISSNRPTGANGMIRYNTSLGGLEGFFAGAWQTIASGTGVGTVQTITTSTGLLGGTITANGTISVDVGTAASKIVQENASSQIAQPNGSAALPAFSFFGSPNSGLFSPSVNSVALSANGTAGVTVTSTGQVAIGTTSTVAALEVYALGTTSAMLVPRDIQTNRPTGTNGMIRYNTTSNALESFVNGAWQTVAVGAGVGTVQSITGSTGLLGGTITGIGTFTVDVGTGANKIVQENSSSQIAQANGSVALPAFSFVNSPSTGWYSPGAGTAALATNGTARLTVDGAGNVGVAALGVGTNTPGALAEFYGTGSLSAILLPRDTSANRPTGANGMIRYNSAGNVFEGFANGIWQTLASGTGVGTVQTITTSTGLLGGTITANGTISVDVGTAASKIVQENASSQIAQSNGSVALPAFSFANDTATGFYSPGVGTATFATAGTARLTILPNGNVGVGSASPAYPLDVNGVLNATSLTINAGQALARSGGSLNINNSSQAQGVTIWSGSNASTPSITVQNVSGNVGVGTTSPLAALDVATLGTASAILVPRDIASNRPSGVNGMIRYNTSTNVMEAFVNNAWQTFAVGSGVGTVQTITATTGLLGGTITANGTISVDVGTAASKIVQENASSQIAQANGSVSLPAFSFVNSPSTGWYSPGAGTAALATNGTARLTVDGAGNVGVSALGVGTNTPAALAEFYGTGSLSAILLPRDSTSNRPTGANGMIRYNNAGNVFEGFANGIWQTLASGTSVGTVQTITTSTGLLGGTITANGTISVDVGTAASKIVQENASSQIAQANGSASLPAFSFVGSPNSGLFSPSANSVALSANGTAGVTVTSTGQVAIGTTSTVAALEVYALGTTSALLLPRDIQTNRPAGTNGMIRYNMTSNALETFVNGSWQTVAVGAGVGTVQSITGSTGLLGGTITGVGTFTVDVGTAANQIVQENASSQIAQPNGSVSAPAFSFANSTSTGWYSPGAGTAALATAGTARLTALPGGYMGIGTTAPTETLSIVANGTTSASGASLNVMNSASTSMLYVRNDGRVGIGTTAPKAALHVGSGSGATPSTSTFFVENSGSSNSGSAFQVATAVSTSPMFTVSNAGNVGVGTQVPAAALDVATTGALSAIVVPRDTSANRPTGVNGMIRYNVNTNAMEAFVNNSWQSMAVGTGVGTVQSITATTGLLGGTITATGTVSVDVGTAASKIVQENTNAQIAQDSGTASNPTYTFANNTATGMYSPGTGSLAFATAGAQAMSINSSGYVGVGTSSAAYPLQIATSNPTPLMLLQRTSSNNSNILFGNTAYSYFAGLAPSGNFAMGLNQNLDTSPTFAVTQAGKVGINTATPGAALDIVGTGTSLSAMIVPRDVTTNRPTGANGMIRYNTSSAVFEGFANGTWQTLASGTGVGTVQSITGSTGLLGGTITASGTLSVNVGTAASQVVQENANAQIAQANGTVALPSFSFANSTSTGLYSPGAGTAALATNGTARLTIDGVGNVSVAVIGVGTAAPAALADFYGTGSLSAILLPRDSAANRPTGVNGMIRYNSAAGMFEGFANGIWQTVASGTSVGTVQTIATSTGLLGGTITSNGTLSVNAGTAAGQVVLEQTNGQILQAAGSATAPTHSFIGSTGTGMYLPAANSVALSANGTAALSIASTGQVSIGTTSTVAALEVYALGTTSALLIPRDTTANRPTGINGMIRYNSNTNVMEAFVNSSWQTFAVGSGVGTVQSITGSTGLLGGTITASGTLSVNVGTAASQVVQENANAQIAQANGTVALPSFSFANSTSTGLYSPGAGTATLATNGTARLTVDGVGNVLVGALGVGTAAPAALADFYGTGSSSAILLPRDTAANRPTGVNGMIRYNSASAVFEGFANGIWQTVASGTTVGTVQSITGSTGLLGGTITASGTLSVNVGTAAAQIVQENTNAQIAQANGSVALPAFSFVGSPSTGLFSPSTNSVALSANGTAGLTLAGSGQVAIGTTSTVAALEVFALGTTSAMLVPRDITANRPTGTNGMIRYNTSLGALEGFFAGAWQSIAAGTSVGTVQTIATSTGLLGGTITSNGTISVNAGTAAGQVVLEQANGQILQASGSAAAPTHSFVGSIGTGMYSPAANSVALSANGTAALTVLSSGYVGIGTTSPANNLEVNGTFKASGTWTGPNGFLVQNWTTYGSAAWIDMPTTGPSAIGSGGVGANAWVAYVSSTGNYLNDASTGDIVYRNTTGKLMFGTSSGNSTMAISGTKVGIGTSAPAAALDVALVGTNSAILVPRDTTANRPTGVNGMIRYNSNTNVMEAFVNSSWQTFAVGSGVGTVQSITGSTGLLGGTITASGTLSVNVGTAASQIVQENTNAQIAQASGSVSLPAYTFANSTSTGWYSPGAGTATLATNGTARLTVDGVGNVLVGALGVGTAAPAALADFYGTGSSSAILLPRDTAANRPTGVNGMIRYNSAAGVFEGFANGIWQTVASGTAVGTVQTIATSTGLLGGTITSNGTISVNAGTAAGQVVLEQTNGQILQAAGSAAAPTHSFVGSTGTGMYSPAANSVALSANGTAALSIASTGQVAIGTTSTVAALEVFALGTTSAMLVPRDTTSNRPTGVNGMIRYNASTNAMEAFVNSAWQNFAVGTGVGTVQNIVTSTGLLGGPITSSGTLSINAGTAAGQVVLEQNNGQILQASGSAAAPTYSFVNGTGTGMYSPSTNQLAFGTAGTAAMTILNTGYIGIGTTNPTVPFHMQSSSYVSPQMLLQDGGTASTPAYPGSFTPALSVVTSATSGSRPLFFGYQTGSSWNAYMTAGACGAFSQMCVDLGNGTTTYTALANNGSTLFVGGGTGDSNATDGSFVNVLFGNTGSVGTPRSTLDNGSGFMGVGTTSPGAGLDISTTGTAGSAVLIPRDTTSNRPTGTNGMMRYNSSNNKFEVFENAAWTNIISANGTSAITSLTGDVTATGPGAAAATIAANAVTSAKINNSGVAVNRLLITDSSAGSTVGYATCSTAGQVMSWTATGWTCNTSISSITTSTGLISGTITTSGTISVNAGTGANQIVMEQTGGQILQAVGTASAPAYSFVGATGTGLFATGTSSLALATNGTTAVSVSATGDATMAKSLTVTGQAVSTAQINTASSATLTFDVSLGNTMVWSPSTTGSTATVNIYNMKAGGQYTLIVRDTATTSLTFTGYAGTTGSPGTALTNSFMPANAARATNATFYNLISDGTYVYIIWMTGMN